MKTITVSSNETELKDFKKGWIAKYSVGDGLFNLLLTEEQYDALWGSDHDLISFDLED